MDNDKSYDYHRKSAEKGRTAILAAEVTPSLPA